MVWNLCMAFSDRIQLVAIFLMEEAVQLHAIILKNTKTKQPDTFKKDFLFRENQYIAGFFFIQINTFLSTIPNHYTKKA